ncbi:MAG: fructosamine kinase family protein [Planctomycetota bacterium]
MDAEVRRRVGEALGSGVTSCAAVAGGDINDAWRCGLADGRAVFVKTNGRSAALPGLFAAEAAGLAALRGGASESGGAVRVPEVLAAGEDFLAIEYIEMSRASGGFEERLGQGLAALHRATRRDDGRVGFERPTYLGRILQDNGWMDDAAAFWRDRRLRPLLDDLTAYPAVVDLGRRLADRLDDILASGEREAVLIHGDLWTGNAAADGDGGVCLFDPACAYLPREVEFGMTRLFGYGDRFERAYEEVWPLPAGWERRVEVYRLHHLLSHLWHFGGGYLGSCQAALQRLV